MANHQIYSSNQQPSGGYPVNPQQHQPPVSIVLPQATGILPSYVIGSGAPPVYSGKVQSESREWSVGLCQACGHDFGTCCIGCIVPCVNAVCIISYHMTTHVMMY